MVKPVAKRAAVNKLSARRKRDASEYLQEPIVVEDLEDLALLINALQRLNDLNGVEESSQNLYLPGTGEEEGMGPERFESEQEDPELIPESVARALLAAQEENEGDEEADRYERPRRGGYGRYGGYGRSPFRSLYYRRSLRSSMDDESPGEIDDEGIGYPLVDPEAVEEENIEEMLDEAELEDRIAKLARAILSREEKRRKK